MSGDAASFRGWRRPGPEPPGGVAVEEGETLDYLSGRFRIFQYERGHRFSTDDVLVAWWGVTHAPRVERLLDLGSGIGSVAMLAAWRLPGARVVTIEAQELSIRLARKSVAFNGLSGRFRIVAGDLRDASRLEGEAPFDLVLGSPPYFPPGTATAARHPQAVPARIETRGDIAAYAAAAGRHLVPGGLFAFVLPASSSARADAALGAARLHAVRRRDVVFREGEDARVALWAAWRAEDLPPAEGRRETLVEPPLVIRRRDGTRSAEYAAIRLSMGLPPGEPTPGGAAAAIPA